MLERIESIEVERELVGRGIRAICYDGDDTIWKTSRVFFKRISEAAKVFADEGWIGQEEGEKLILEEMNALVGKILSDPQMAPLSVAAAFFKLGRGEADVEVLERAQAEMMKIYWEDVPELCEGVLEAREIWKGFRLIENVETTWADERWNRHKMKGSGMEGSFDVEWSMPVGAPKSYREVIASRGLFPDQVIVIGDSYKNDVLAAIEAGVPAENIFKVKGWSESGPLPEGVREVDNVYEVFELIMRERREILEDW